MLSQRIDGAIRVIAFASRALSTVERVEVNYSSKKLEFLAVVWAVSDKFRHYLIGSKCTVITDNSALSYLERKKTLTALEDRWVARLAPFDLTIKYISVNLNGVADALSRKREVGDIEETDIKILYEDDLDVNEVVVMEEISDVELRKDQLADVKVREIIKGEKIGDILGYGTEYYI